MLPQIDSASRKDLPSILKLLSASGLPEASLGDHLDTTVVLREDGGIVGCSAVEVYGTSGLLRSVAVRSDRQGRGHGARLTQAALGLASARGVDTVYLLTETAAGFFPRFGFEPVQRAAVRPEVLQSVEFISACPETATVMTLRIPPSQDAHPSR